MQWYRNKCTLWLAAVSTFLLLAMVLVSKRNTLTSEELKKDIFMITGREITTVDEMGKRETSKISDEDYSRVVKAIEESYKGKGEPDR